MKAHALFFGLLQKAKPSRELTGNLTDVPVFE
jgi:hypothetical protein